MNKIKVWWNRETEEKTLLGQQEEKERHPKSWCHVTVNNNGNANPTIPIKASFLVIQADSSSRATMEISFIVRDRAWFKFWKVAKSRWCN